MNYYIITVPNSPHYQEWGPFIQKSLENGNCRKPLIVDFNTVSFLDTDDFVILACIIEVFYLNGSTVEFRGGTSGFNAHLANIKFKDYWNEGFDRTGFTLSLNRSTLCLWKISKERSASYSNYAREYFERKVGDKDLIPLATSMDEVFNNIFDHSNSPVDGYIITQYYPNKKKISFSVCDLGVGVADSVKHKYPAEYGDKEDFRVMFQALQEGFSVKSTPRNRGFGLANIISFIVYNKGVFQMISNLGVIGINKDGKYQIGPIQYRFNGTLIKVEIDLNKLNEKEYDTEIFSFE